MCEKAKTSCCTLLSEETVTVRFQYFSGDAQLNFDLGFKEEVNIKNTVAKVKSQP